MAEPYCDVEGCHDTRTHTYQRTGPMSQLVDARDGSGRRLCWIHAMHEFNGYAWDDLEGDGDGPVPVPMLRFQGRETPPIRMPNDPEGIRRHQRGRLTKAKGWRLPESLRLHK